MKIGKYKITTRELIIFLSAFIVIFNLYCLAWIPPSPYIYRGTFLSTFIIITVMLNPPKSKISKILILPFVLMALVGSIYPMIFGDKLTAQLFQAFEAEIPIAIIFLIGFSVVVTRVRGGLIILGLTWVMIIYLILGHHIPGLFHTPVFPVDFVATVTYTDIDLGAFGFYNEINCRLISIFMVFAALLMATGLGDLFIAIACRLAGRTTGGPAKVAIFSSGLFGMLSGSPVANVAATGSFTIPLMKKIGYKPRMAATVEALASTGGALMPPIMAIAAFIMSELLGIPYLRICLAGLIPVFLWYFVCFFSVHYYALAEGIKKWRPSTEEFMGVIRAKFHLIFAIFALVGALFYFSAAEQGALFAVIFLLILASLRKSTRLTKAKIVDFLQRYARMFGPLFVLVVCLSILIGAMLGSGVHMKVGLGLLGGIEKWYLVLLIAGLLVVLFGMAIPGTAAYLAGIAVLAPILARIGSQPLVAHMFVFYVATLAPLTPPVCLASFTAARIAGTDMMKTGVETTIKGLPLWIIPFAIFKKELLLGVGTPLSVIAIGVATLCFGAFIFILGAEGFFRRALNRVERILACVIGVMIVQPISDFCSYIFIGIGILLFIYLYSPRFSPKSQG
ncbi:hypothetical protein ES706_01407 [subsurface metagenome]